MQATKPQTPESRSKIAPGSGTPGGGGGGITGELNVNTSPVKLWNSPGGGVDSLNPDTVPVERERGRDNDELRRMGEVEFVVEEKRVTNVPFNKMSRANGTVTPWVWVCKAPFPEMPVSESAVNPGKEILSVLNESSPVQVTWAGAASAP